MGQGFSTSNAVWLQTDKPVRVCVCVCCGSRWSNHSRACWMSSLSGAYGRRSTPPHRAPPDPCPLAPLPQYYHDGDVVQGVVCLNVVTPVVITSIECQVRGVQGGRRGQGGRAGGGGRGAV